MAWIETTHPGSLGSQNTCYVGNTKGARRIYQPTFVDTCAKVAVAKFNTTKPPRRSRFIQWSSLAILSGASGPAASGADGTRH